MKKTILILSAILFFVVNSCNKDEDVSELIIPEVQEGTTLVSATINEKEIGGSNLTVSSVYYPDSPIKDNGFKTIVSQEGTQVVLVLDGDNAIRGLSYTKKTGNNYELVPVDATSTFISLFLLTPGITTTTSEETVELVNILKTLPSYQKIISEIKNNLLQSTLNQLISNENINGLYSELITEYIDKISTNSNNQTKSTQLDLYGNRLSVLKNKDGLVEISNQAFRRINVYRSYVDNSQVTDSKLLFESMKGGVGVSWGSLFTFSSFEPTIKVDVDYLPPTQSSITEYWVIGPGLAESEEIPPSYIDEDIDQALTETCIYYVLFPMLDLLNGTSKLIDKDGLVKTFFESTKEVRNGTKGLKYLNEMKNASDKKAFNRAMINYAVLLGKSAIAIPSIAGLVGVSSSVAGTIGTCLTILAIPMSVANLSAFTADYFKQPKYSKFTIATQLNPPILLLPTNSSQVESTSVTFSWEKNPLAWKYVIEISNNTSFEEKTIKTTDGITTNLTLTMEPSSTYYWRVYCTKGDGSPSDYSEVWTFSTGEDNFTGDSGTFTDARDGQVYKWVRIGDQIWMAENLKYNGAQALSYNNNSSFVEEYGYLYWGDKAAAACPAGWHLPTQDEFITLSSNFGGFDNAGGALKESGLAHWSSPNTGATDESGFTALPGGWGNFNSNNGQLLYRDMGNQTKYWSSTTYQSGGYTLAKILRLSYSEKKAFYNDGMERTSFYASVRCIKD